MRTAVARFAGMHVGLDPRPAFPPAEIHWFEVAPDDSLP